MSVAASGTHRHPPTTLDSRRATHKTQTKPRQRGERTTDPWQPGGEASTASQHCGGGGWGAAESRGRGRRQVEPCAGVVGSNGCGAGGIGVGIGGWRRRRRRGWWHGWRRPRCHRRSPPSSTTSSATLAATGIGGWKTPRDGAGTCQRARRAECESVATGGKHARAGHALSWLWM